MKTHHVVKMHWCILFLFTVLQILIYFPKQIFAKQSFDQEPPKIIEVNPGQDVILPCRIFDKSRNSVCNWQKDGYPISLQRGKYQWDGERQRGDCSLKIIKADINFDNGKISVSYTHLTLPTKA